MRRRKNKISKVDAYFALIAGIVMGTIFVFGMRYWNAPIEIDDGVSVTTSFLDYEVLGREGRNIKEIKMINSDYHNLFIDGSCVDDITLQALQGLTKGDELHLIVHPNSSTILQMTSKGSTILSFQESQSDLLKERNGFGVLGILMYAISIYALVCLVKRETR